MVGIKERLKKIFPGNQAPPLDMDMFTRQSKLINQLLAGNEELLHANQQLMADKLWMLQILDVLEAKFSKNGYLLMDAVTLTRSELEDIWPRVGYGLLGDTLQPPTLSVH